MRSSLRRLYAHMSRRRRRNLRYVLVLMAVSAIAELVALGAILPFLTLLSDPSRALAIPLVVEFFALFGAREPNELVLAAAVMFALAAITAGIVRLMFAWSSQAFVFRWGHELGVEMQRRILHQPYTYHVMTNSSEAVSGLEKVQTLIFSYLSPLSQATAAALISIFIVSALVIIDPVVALASAASFSLVYLLVSLSTRSRLNRNSKIVTQSYADRVQAVQESMGGIRDILIDRAQPEYVQHFERIDRRLRWAQIVTAFIGAAPRFVIEAFGMVLIAGVALSLASREGGIGAALPVLGALALGAQRLLPLIQQIYFGWAQMSGHSQVLGDVVALLELPCEETPRDIESLQIKNEILLKKVSFSYPERAVPVLEDIDLAIPKGSRIALVGQTGSGKSTLVDIVMGLLQPTQGELLVDGQPLRGGARLAAWQANIAHVPQAIFLADKSIIGNIAFGVPVDQIDRERAERAARQAQLHDFISGLPDGYDSDVGERGVRLSGGQRQRLGIARALYKNASVLVLDEATSALDDATEASVMSALDSLDRELTVIMIAHRLSTIAKCDQVVRLSEGRIVERGTYASVIQGLQLEQV